jgi:hypothetical protein
MMEKVGTEKVGTEGERPRKARLFAGAWARSEGTSPVVQVLVRHLNGTLDVETLERPALTPALLALHPVARAVNEWLCAFVRERLEAKGRKAGDVLSAQPDGPSGVDFLWRDADGQLVFGYLDTADTGLVMLVKPVTDYVNDEARRAWERHVRRDAL